MGRVLISLGLTFVLTACASVRLETVAVAEPVCGSGSTQSESRFSSVSTSDIKIAKYLNTPVAAFSSRVPSVEQIRTNRVASKDRRDEEKKTYDALLGQIPYNEGLDEETAISHEAATAARDLSLMLAEITPKATAADEQLRKSLESSGGKPGFATTLANITAKDDTSQRLAKIVQAGGDDALMLSSLDDLTKTLMLFSRSKTNFSESEEKIQGSALADAAANFETSRFVRTYLKSYFRGGQILQSEFKVDEYTTTAMAEINKQVKLSQQDATNLEAKLKEVFSKACKSKGDAACLFTSLGKDKLVTRSGETIQFKGVSLSIGYDSRANATWDYPKSAEFAPQLVRVITEATFDAMHGRPPAVASATACATTPSLFGKNECVSADQEDLLKKIAALDEKASRADSIASIATGQIIRGISVVALNNEALAKTAENLAGVLARKAIERAVWQQSGEGKCTPSSAPAAIINVVKN